MYAVVVLWRCKSAVRPLEHPVASRYWSVITVQLDPQQQKPPQYTRKPFSFSHWLPSHRIQGAV
jgi:hypothetical protein